MIEASVFEARGEAERDGKNCHHTRGLNVTECRFVGRSLSVEEISLVLLALSEDLDLMNKLLGICSSQ